MRLQKYIALCGIASRRAAETLISEGKVTVNGTVITEMGTKVSGKDVVTVEGKVIKPERNKIYILLNKPKGVLSTVKDDRGRECVTDIISGVNERMYPVGRLDYDTTGLIILTNDGDFMQRLTHPSFEVWKTYEAVVKGVPTQSNITAFQEGIELEDGKTLPAVLEVVGYKGNDAIVEVSLREGRNRQVRRMLEYIHHPVTSLKRIRLGTLELGDVRPGHWRNISMSEISDLLKSDN